MSPNQLFRDLSSYKKVMSVMSGVRLVNEKRVKNLMQVLRLDDVFDRLV